MTTGTSLSIPSPFYGGGQVPNPCNVSFSTAAPSNNAALKPGMMNVDTTNGNVYVSTGVGVWAELGGLSGPIDSLTPDSGGAQSPNAGTISVLGTANQIATTGTTNTVTFSLIGPYTPATYTAHGVLLGEGTSSIVATTAGSNGQVFLGSTSADPGFGTLTTSTGVAYTTGAKALAIDLKQGGFKVNAASTGGSLVAQNAYTVTQATQTSFALPATAAVGDHFLIASGTGNTSGWIITQGSGQIIYADSNHTTSGATGTLAGAIHDSVVLMCVIANTEFIVVGGSGLTGLTFT
jgi:hypothetical protein